MIILRGDIKSEENQKKYYDKKYGSSHMIFDTGILI